MRTRQILFRIGVLVGDEGFSILYFFVMLFVLIIFIFFVHVYDTNAHLIQLQILRRSFLYLENLYNFLMKREKKKKFLSDMDGFYFKKVLQKQNHVIISLYRLWGL